MKHLISACALSALMVGGALAAPVSIGFNAGEITEIDDQNNTGAFAGFSVGEDVFVEFTVDDTTPDDESNAQDGNFDDPLGTITITGLTNGATLNMIPGVEIEFDDPGEFELQSLFINTDASTQGYLLEGDIDLNTNEMPALTSNPDNLPTALTDLAALLSGGVFTGIENTVTLQAGVLFFSASDGSSEAAASMLFGPVPTQTAAPVPLPAGGMLLLSGLAAVGIARRRRT